MNPLISIIVPNYNHERFLNQRLESVFNQTFQDFEVILLDDCSTDNSQEILLQYAQHPKVSHCVFNKVNSGNTFVQWQKGIQLAKGEYIWIAESDDYCELDFLKEVSKPLIENKDVSLSYCQSNRVNEDGEIMGTWKFHTDDLDEIIFDHDFVMDGNLFAQKYLIYKNVIPNASALLFRKEAFQLLDEKNVKHELRYCGDWLLYFKMVLNKKIAFTSWNLNNFRYHSQSVIFKAGIIEDRLSLIEIELLLRFIFFNFLKRQKNNNIGVIAQCNCFIIRELKYERGILCIRNNKKIKGFFVLLSIFFFFIKKYDFRKKIQLSLRKVFLWYL